MNNKSIFFSMKNKNIKPLKNINQRAWQRMLSGRKLDILSPSPFDIEIEDIALGLSRVTRWNGQTNGKYPYSVAQHSILVEEIFNIEYPDLDIKWNLAALLHDAPEYVIGDLITPFKYALNNSYRFVEDNLMKAIYLRFGLPALLPMHIETKIKKIDKALAWFEAVDLAGYKEKEASEIIKKPNFNFKHKIIIALSPNDVEKRFLKRFHKIILKMS